MNEQRWTSFDVEGRMAEAASVMRRLPEVRVRGYFNTWPTIIPEFSDLVGREPPRLKLPPPSPAAISRCDEATYWLRWLEPDDVRIVWMRAENRPWKIVCRHVGLSRTAAWERWAIALCIIALKLNGERVPQHPARLRALALEMRRRKKPMEKRSRTPF